jgi:GDP-L-fucose synthase
VIRDEVLGAFAGRAILVTGGTGLIGRQVVDLLCAAGASVRVVSLDRIATDPRVEYIHGDLTEFSLCRDVMRDVEMVCHLAGVKGSADVSRTQLASHFVPTLMFNTNVLEAARRAGIKKLVYTSSIGAYANAEVFVEGDQVGTFTDSPMDFAGWAKRITELQVHAYHAQYGIDGYALVRPANVYGPGDNFDPENAMVVPSILMRIHRGEDPVLIWGDGTAVRDLVFSRDVAEGILLALHHGTRGTYVNLGSGAGVTVRELVETLRGFLDFNYQFDVTKPGGFPKRVMDISRASEWVDYRPTTTLGEGLRKTWEWFMANEDEYLRKQNYFKNSAPAETR